MSPRSPFVLSTVALAALAACETKPVTLLPGMAYEGFVAPATPGEYTAGGTEVVVRAIDAVELTATAPAIGARGGVRYEATLEGDAGARARFTGPSGTTVEVVVADGAHATLTFGGVTLDGDGALSPAEDAALRAMAASELFPALAMVPLDLGCVAPVNEPRLMAALLVPWQAVSKYLTADRAAQAHAFAAASRCRWFPEPSKADARPAPRMPIFSNGQLVPMATGYLPFDAAGALGANASVQGLSIDTDVFGPGMSMCRGACGADCEENNCGQPVEEWRCVKQDGRNTGWKQHWKRYTCGEHPGCIEHDACFDNCKTVFGVGSFESGVCMRGCDLQAAMGYGAAQGLEWAVGHGPFTHEKSYDYSDGAPVKDEETCPVSLSLIAQPGSGRAPLATVLRWEGLESPGGPERCRLDYGDGSEPVTIDPCPASGERSHTYAVPSEMRSSRGVYTASLKRIGANVTATADVQATWLFEASPASGDAPLVTGFRWEGFALVGKPLTCTIDFGDGSAPETITGCATSAGTFHTYATAGTYLARITARGEDRPVTETASIVVRGDEPPPAECGGVRTIASWHGKATFSYAISARSARRAIEHSASGSVEARLTRANQGPGGISFHGLSPTGQVTLHEVTNSLAPNARNPESAFDGSGAPLGPTNGADSGSNMLLNVDLDECRYNVHVQVRVAGTARHADESSPAEAWVASFQSPWLPLPASGKLTDSTRFTAHSEEWILTSPNLPEYYWVYNWDLIDILGEAGLGEAQITYELSAE